MEYAIYESNIIFYSYTLIIILYFNIRREWYTRFGWNTSLCSYIKLGSWFAEENCRQSISSAIYSPSTVLIILNLILIL